MYKGGYQILDLTGYDLSIDGNNNLTNEKTINYLLNFKNNYKEKPVLLLMKFSGIKYMGFCFVDNQPTMLRLTLGGMSQNFGILFLFEIDTSLELVKLYTDEI